MTIHVGRTRQWVSYFSCLVLAPGETLLLYTDGLTDIFAPGHKTMFGGERLIEALNSSSPDLSLAECAEQVCEAVTRFTGQTELQDDQTLLLLRRT